jgi:hypothetical protein
MELHSAVMELIPYTLGVSPLDCETLNLTVGFDFAYRGNQQELVWEALGYASGFERGLDRPGRRLIGNDYGMTVAIDEDCRTQFRLHIEPRTTAYAIKSGEFGEEPLSVYLTVRRYGSLEGDDSYASLLERLFQNADSLIKEFVVDQVLLPIQHTISIR